jgi:putative phosphoesterase
MAFLYRTGIDLLVHCGDVTTVETALLMAEFRLIYVYGNLDQASGEIRRALLAYDAENFSGPIFSGEVGGVPMAIIHGDLPGSVDKLARSGTFRYVLHGHTHLRRQEQVGGAWMINPGALGGARRETRSICLLETVTGEVKFVMEEDFGN